MSNVPSPLSPTTPGLRAVPEPSIWIAKQSLIRKRLLDKGGAITTQGRNALVSENAEV